MVLSEFARLEMSMRVDQIAAIVCPPNGHVVRVRFIGSSVWDEFNFKSTDEAITFYRAVHAESNAGG